jgi:DNA processing protein
MGDPRDWIAVAALPDLGPASIKRLWDHGWTPEKLFNSSSSDWQRLGLKKSTLNALNNYQCGSRKSLVSERVELALNWRGAADDHSILAITDPAYPTLLRELTDPPPVLFVKGEVTCLNLPQIGVVGSRSASVTGLGQAATMAEYLSESGFVINSGLALGVDAAAHMAAVKSKLPTIAVLGTGVDRIYPSRNQSLAESILSNKGAWVSEFFPGTAPLASHFPRRNRIISGMSLGILVVEAALRSGSLITARMAMEQNREVFAIPGPLNNPLSKGCHQLIREGAVLVESGADIVRELGSLLGVIAPVKDEDSASEPEYQVDPELGSLLQCMGFEICSVDQISQRSGLSVAKLSSMLVELELKGMISQTSSGYVRS